MTNARASADVVMGIGAGPYVVRLHVASAVAPAVRSTLRDLLIHDDVETPFEAFAVSEGDGTYRLSADGRLFQEHVQAQWVPDFVVRMLLLAALDAHPERLHVHAGLVADGGAGVLVAGLSGAGKSTLVTGLVRAGFDYVTDERVAIDPDDLVVSGFPKPISLDLGSFAMFDYLDPATTGAGQSTETEWQVPASTIGTGRVLAHSSVRAVVMVDYQEGAPLHVERIHPVSMATDLLVDSPDMARFGDRASAVAVRLCAGATCVRLTYHRLADAEAAIRDVLATAPGEPDVMVLSGAEAGKGLAPSQQIRVSDVLVRSNARPVVVADGRALAYGPGDIEVIELDEASTAWFMLLDGRATVSELVDAAREESGGPRRPLEAGALRVLSSLATQGLAARFRAP